MTLAVYEDCVLYYLPEENRGEEQQNSIKSIEGISGALSYLVNTGRDMIFGHKLHIDDKDASIFDAIVRSNILDPAEAKSGVQNNTLDSKLFIDIDVEGVYLGDSNKVGHPLPKIRVSLR